MRVVIPLTEDSPMKLLFLATMLLSLAAGETIAQSKDPAIEDLNWVAVVTKNEATFMFPATKRTSWSWYNSETQDGLCEYSWNVMIGDHKSGFQFGPALFKSNGSQTANGSLSDLINACQHDLWRVSEDGGDNVGGYGKTKLEDGKVRLTISDPKLLEQLFGPKPKTVQMMINTPEFLIRQKVEVTHTHHNPGITR